MIDQFKCDYSYVLVAGVVDSYPVTSSSTCSVTATSSLAVPVSATSSPEITRADFLLMFGVMLFLLMFVPLGFIGGVFTRNKKHD